MGDEIESRWLGSVRCTFTNSSGAACGGSVASGITNGVFMK